MFHAGDNLKKMLEREIAYYRAQNENLKKELSDLEKTYSNNRTRLEIISVDYEESEEMIRILKSLTK
ncbi:hypothetical protein IX51_05345 [uncultured archaeon]|nr:hypothetical protein IX51_05345 [uncultured archaeon]